jgi:hypothetical protein
LCQMVLAYACRLERAPVTRRARKRRRRAAPKATEMPPTQSLETNSTPAGTQDWRIIRKIRNIACAVGQISGTSSPQPGPRRGALAIVTERGPGMRWTRQRRRETELQGGISRERYRPRKTTAPMSGEASRLRRVAAYGKSVWSWHPLLVSSRWRFCGPNRVSQNRRSADDGDKTNSSPGRARHKP